MTREALIKHWDVIQAFKEGKEIQYYDTVDNCWYIAYEPSFRLDMILRIKPEPTKRLPTIEEVKEWFMENRVFKNKDGLLARISTIDVDKAPIGIDVYCLAIEDFCEQYTHVDGTSLLIEEV